MKPTLVLVSIAAAVALTVGLVWHYGVRKPMGGEAVREERALPPFNRIAIEGFADLVLVQGSAESISIEGAPEYLRSLRFEVIDGKLVLANSGARHGWLDIFNGEARPIHATLTFRKLDAISVEGAAKLRADRLETDRLAVSASGATKLSISALDAKELAVSGSGAFKMDIAGRTVAQQIRISGAGDYRASKLQSETAKVTVSGAGRVAILAEKTLDIDLSGAGSVEYFGNPKVTQDIRGVGRVKKGVAE